MNLLFKHMYLYKYIPELITIFRFYYTAKDSTENILFFAISMLLVL